MSAYATESYRRFTRDADRAAIGGVCAGLARHFGFNLCVTRFLFVIVFLMTFPFALIAYLAVVVLVPSESWRDEYVVERVVHRRRRRRMSRRERRQAEFKAREQAAEEVSERARSLEERLARIEKHVTSSRYQLDREFDRLKD